MSKQLIMEDKDHSYALTEYYGGKDQGTMYQITQYNKENSDYYYVQLHKQDIINILIGILESECNVFEKKKKKKVKKK